MKCSDKKCRFVGLDLDRWDYPYSDHDYYENIQEIDVNPKRSFIVSRAKLIKTFVGRGRICDLGSGLGETAIALSKMGFDVIGVDESWNAISFLKRHYKSVRWECSNINDFLRRNRSLKFDAILMFHVLEHIPRPSETVRLVKESLINGGWVLVEVPDVQGGIARLKGKKWEYYLVHHVNYFSTTSLKRLMEPFGFKLVYSQKMFHFGHPQGVWWKDVIKGTLARIGLNSIIRTFWRSIV